MNDPLVRYIGEVGEKEKQELLRNAHALLFPIDWPEPFGLVMIEALATGTPVVVSRVGSAPEIVDDGVTGYLRQGRVALADALTSAATLEAALHSPE